MEDAALRDNRLYRFWIFVLVICLVLALSGCGGTSTDTDDGGQRADGAAEVQTEVDADDQNSAYETAKGMLSAAPFSRQGMIDYLSSEAGGGYTEETAEAAIKMMEDQGEVDWFAEAEKAAKDYKDMMLVTKEEVLEQLSSESGDQFTMEEAEAAVEKVFEE